MKKTIAVILTVSMVVGSSTVAFAKSKDVKDNKKVLTTTQTAVTATESSITVSNAKGKENNKGLEKVKSQLNSKLDGMIGQLQKLKSYIVASDGTFLVEFKDAASANTSIKSIGDAIIAINNMKNIVSSASSVKQVKDIAKDLHKNWLKNQVIMKRITGLTSAARLKAAYEKTKELVYKLQPGVANVTGAGVVVSVEDLQKQYDSIKTRLEAAREKYLEAVVMFSSITDVSNSDKNFKAAQEKLMEAKKELNQVLVDTKQLLETIRGEIKARIEKEDHSDGKDIDEDEEDDDLNGENDDDDDEDGNEKDEDEQDNEQDD